MKTKLIIASLLVSLNSFAQVGSGNGKALHYESVIKTDSTFKKGFLFENAIDWMSRNFKSSKAVIQSQDKEDGFIIGRFAYTSILGGPNITSDNAYIKISVKDGKIKYELYDFNNDLYGVITDGEWEDKQPFGKEMRKKIYARIQDDSKRQAETLITSLTSYFINLKPDKNW